MKVVYCANCGKCLPVTRKALPKYGKIIDIVEHHLCSDEPIELNLTPNPVPIYTEQKKEKFVEILNELEPPKHFTQLGTNGLRDRRNIDHVKADSTAPISLLEHVRGMKDEG